MIRKRLKKWYSLSIPLLLLCFCKESVYAQTATIQFFDEEQQLLSSQTLEVEEEMEIPSYIKDGYIFHGYNTKADGSGSWIMSNLVEESINYYAIMEKRTFKVFYYIDDTLYSIQTVEYMGDAPELFPEEIEGYEFRGWEGRREITQDTYLYSTYDEIETVHTEEETLEQEKKKEDLKETAQSEESSLKETLKETQETKDIEYGKVSAQEGGNEVLKAYNQENDIQKGEYLNKYKEENKSKQKAYGQKRVLSLLLAVVFLGSFCIFYFLLKYFSKK